MFTETLDGSSLFAIMHRNLINLILACGILVLVVGCYCRSGRDKDDPTTIGQSEDNEGEK